MAAHGQLAELASEEPPDGLEDIELVHRALELVRADFEVHTWQAFWLTAIDQQKPASVAAELNISVASVYQAKTRVIRRIRQELQRLME